MIKTAEQIKELLKKSSRAIICAHVDPDGDAIGSMLALGMVCNKLGLETVYYCADNLPKIYRFLPHAGEITRELPDGQFDVVLTVDSSDLSRIGNKIDLRKLAKVVVNIDHHPDNTHFGDINYVQKASSAAELVFDLAQAWLVGLDKAMADCLYTAMITDTGNFRYENTTIKTFQIAGELLKAGVSTHEISTKIYDTKTLPSIKISARALAGLQISPDKKIAWAYVTEEMMRETKAEGEDLIGIVDRLRSIEGVEVAVFFREKAGEIKINFRSKERVNVCELAKRFQGGGHFKAAGAVVKGELIKVIDQVIGETTRVV
ncbi:hypothetical protein A2311_03125 [candidate division WOR-1 bacterium RIFOXYB2_FULL_48_7]|uniref:DDH domain-containing protein n=1 Tax=candidate division WOR-1 bacterium RIFOXYB2_FULL_48_7 TaxID=1802583 RepID=A0A1F4TR21_UNCSA|nr:MAG: hypothetical protein A2311_03125 [candidate division WOR-1 bacterium RIFOXYB2_FULL_48_7]